MLILVYAHTRLLIKNRFFVKIIPKLIALSSYDYVCIPRYSSYTRMVILTMPVAY